jgi:hypothetical protein
LFSNVLNTLDLLCLDIRVQVVAGQVVGSSDFILGTSSPTDEGDERIAKQVLTCTILGCLSWLSLSSIYGSKSVLFYHVGV